MTGLEKMVGRILEDAKQTADQNLQEAREEAEKIKADSLAQTQSLCDDVARKSELPGSHGVFCGSLKTESPAQSQAGNSF